MALSVVQKASGYNSDTSNFTITFSSSVTSGNAVVVLGLSASGGTATPTGTGWTKILAVDEFDQGVGRLAVWINPSPGAVSSITVSPQGDYVAANAYEVSGLGASPTTDINIGNADTSDPVNSGTADAAHDSELVFGIAASADETLTNPTSGWSNYVTNGGSGYALLTTETKTLTSGGTGIQYSPENPGGVSMDARVFSIVPTPTTFSVSVYDSISKSESVSATRPTTIFTISTFDAIHPVDSSFNQDITNNYEYRFGFGSVEAMATRFVAIGPYLTGVSLYVRRAGSPTGTLTMSIRNSFDGTILQQEGGYDASIAIDVSNVPTSMGFYSYGFAFPVPLTVGNSYVIQYDLDGTYDGTSNYVAWGEFNTSVNYGSPYPDGLVLVKESGTWYNGGTNRFTFRIAYGGLQTLSESITVSSSDSLSVDDVVGYYDEFINVSELVELELISQVIWSASVYNTVSLSESVSASVSGPQVSIHDAISSTDSITRSGTNRLSVVDSRTITENITSSSAGSFSVHDTTPVVESVSLFVYQNNFATLVGDDLEISESISTFFPLLRLSIDDSVVASESQAETETTGSVSLVDGVVVTEHISTGLSSRINVSDSLLVSENVKAVFEFLRPVVFDSVSVSDSIARSDVIQILVHSEVTTSENLSFFNSGRNIEIHDSIIVNDSDTPTDILGISVADLLDVSGSISSTGTISQMTADYVVSSESVSLLFLYVRFSTSDSISITEVTENETVLQAAVQDEIQESDEISSESFRMLSSPLPRPSGFLQPTQVRGRGKVYAY